MLTASVVIALWLGAIAQPSHLQPKSPIAGPALAAHLEKSPSILTRSPDSATIRAGTRMAELLNPVDQIVATELRGFDEQIVPAFRGQKDYAALEARYPGVIDAIARAVRPAMERNVRASLPRSRAIMGVFFAERFALAELVELSTFYGSPTGQKIIRAMFANASMGGIVSEVVADPKAQTSLTAVDEIFRSSLNALPGVLEKSDQEALVALSRNPAFARLKAVGSDMRKLQQQMINKPDPEFEAELDRVLAQAVEAYVAAADAGSASR